MQFLSFLISGLSLGSVYALIALGYSQSEAASALSGLNPDDKVELLVKQALRQLMRG